MRDGIYNNCAAVTAELIESKEKKTPGVEILFRASDEDGGGEIRHTLWLTGGALPYSVKSLRATGWQGDDLSELSSVGAKLCQLVIEGEEYNGRVYPRVKYINPNESVGGGGAGQEKMSDAAKRQFAAKMKGLVIAASGGVASKAAPPARASGGAPVAPRGPAVAQQRAQFDRPPNDVPEPPADLDEDIPF